MVRVVLAAARACESRRACLPRLPSPRGSDRLRRMARPGQTAESRRARIRARLVLPAPCADFPRAGGLRPRRQRACGGGAAGAGRAAAAARVGGGRLPSGESESARRIRGAFPPHSRPATQVGAACRGGRCEAGRSARVLTDSDAAAGLAATPGALKLRPAASLGCLPLQSWRAGHTKGAHTKAGGQRPALRVARAVGPSWGTPAAPAEVSVVRLPAGQRLAVPRAPTRVVVGGARREGRAVRAVPPVRAGVCAAGGTACPAGGRGRTNWSRRRPARAARRGAEHIRVMLACLGGSGLWPGNGAGPSSEACPPTRQGGGGGGWGSGGKRIRRRRAFTVAGDADSLGRPRQQRGTGGRACLAGGDHSGPDPCNTGPDPGTADGRFSTPSRWLHRPGARQGPPRHRQPPPQPAPPVPPPHPRGSRHRRAVGRGRGRGPPRREPSLCKPAAGRGMAGPRRGLRMTPSAGRRPAGARLCRRSGSFG